MKKIGVYICQCGTNIAGKVDVAKIAEEIGAEQGDVAVCRYYKYMCSEPGQKMIRDDIEALKLDHVVEASCSPKMHEPTFRNCVAMAGMNPYQFEMVNIREHCSWVSEDSELATQKAKDLVKAGISRVSHHRPLQIETKPVTKSVLVVGGGIAGITAALKVANAGYPVYLVEKEEIIGGRMAQFDKTFPTMDCAGCTLTPKTSEVGRHPNIEILTKSEIQEVEGFVGNFKVRVRQQPRYVSTEKCTGCGDCLQVCPVNLKSSFEVGLATRHPISRPFPQAIPNTFSIIRAGMPPCQAACPAGVNAQGYMTLAGAGKFAEALALVRQRMPFASACGRICVRPCETACKRGQIDAPLAICQTKRFLGDYAVEQAMDTPPPIPEERNERIAIVGAGPSGMTAAYYLRQQGYQVTVFEKLPVAGGMLAVGIPEYRLPKDVLGREVDYVRQMGVDIRLNSPIGPGMTINDLLTRDGYKAVFVGIGATQAVRLPVPGAEAQGVLWGVDYLKDVRLGGAPSVAGKRVAVIGGGNVAMDVARTALREGAAAVTTICLEAADEMPANAWEVQEAEEESIPIVHRRGVKQVLAADGQVTGLELKAVSRVFDAEGRFAPEYLEDQVETHDTDVVIFAIGQKTEVSFLSEADGVQLTERGLIQVDPETLATSRPGVFAGGDAVLGPATFVQAVAQGRKAAVAIHNFLQYGHLRIVEPQERAVDPAVTEEERLRAKPIPRHPMPVLDPATRKTSYAEIELGFSPEAATEEGLRCLECGLCCQCGECVRKCGPGAVELNQTECLRELEVGAIIVATGIKTFDPKAYPEYGFGKYPDVITNLQFERLCNASGPTGGKLLKPSDGTVPKSIAFIQCVGSRDPARGLSQCSKVCCMISAKQLSIFKHFNPEGQAYVFYIDNRAGGKGYEEFLRRVIEEDQAHYIRGRVAKVFQEGGRLVLRAEDSLAGGIVEVEADMVVLATGLVPQDDYLNVARALNLAADKNGFFLELHPKLGPVETSLSGIYLAGAAQGPKDIPESVAQGGAAAAEVLTLFARGQVQVEPTIALVDASACTGCKTCVGLCAYRAISFSEEQKVAVINEALCQGCGTCAAACPTAAIEVQQFTPEQIFAQIEGMLG